jgi:rare lipoprotein A (peptidoglycan hydrolase)
MDRSRSARLAGALSIGLTAAALPTAAEAQTAAPAPAPTLHVYAKHHVMYGSKAPVKGRLAGGTPRKRVYVQIRSGRRWKTVARAYTRSDGRFRAQWRGNRLGSFNLRAVAPGSGAKPRTAHGKVVVYRRAAASWYGPGLYGNKLACGGTLTPGTLGVANKTLPCGAKVTLRYHGHTATVPVVDRGPYAAGRDYDLTAATKNKLHFGSTGTVLSSR